MSRPAVVMVSANFHPYVGGAEKQALELSKALAAAGVEVTVLTRRFLGLPEEEDLGGVRVRRLAVFGPPFVDSLCFMIGVLAWLARQSPSYQAVHVHLAGSPALAAALAGRLLGKRVLVKLGGGRGIGELAASATTLAGRLKLATLARLKPRFVAVTAGLVEEMAAYGLGDCPVVVVPNGVDARRYRPAPGGDKLTARRLLGYPPDGLIFLYVGRLAPEKRLDLFIEEFASALKETRADARFFVVGAGPSENALRDAARRQGLDEKVRFVQPTPEIERMYAGADVFVLPSISEGLSNALLEAMASGLAVLASRVGGTVDAVREGETGLLFDPRDAGELRRKLTRLLTEPGLAETLGKRAREDALGRFDLAAVAQRYRELYGF